MIYLICLIYLSGVCKWYTRRNGRQITVLTSTRFKQCRMVGTKVQQERTAATFTVLAP